MKKEKNAQGFHEISLRCKRKQRMEKDRAKNPTGSSYSREFLHCDLARCYKPSSFAFTWVGEYSENPGSEQGGK